MEHKDDVSVQNLSPEESRGAAAPLVSRPAGREKSINPFFRRLCRRENSSHAANVRPEGPCAERSAVPYLFRTEGSEQIQNDTLVVSHLTKRYGKALACEDVSFRLEPGSVTVLLGPNGAGKSTIMKSVIGFLRYEGEITVAGYPNKSIEARRLLGYIPELPALYPNLTVAEHMEFLARAYRLSDYRSFVEELFTRFELAEQRKKFGDELSKGMQQKLNLCLGLLPRPRILMLDEPMIGLDPHAIKQLKEYIEALRAEGRTLLVSTHIIDSVDMLWDRALIMRGGRILEDLSRQALEERGQTLEERFFAVTEGAGDAREGV